MGKVGNSRDRINREMGFPDARGRYTPIMLLQDARRAFEATIPDRVALVLGALENLLRRGSGLSKDEREKYELTDFPYHVIYVCPHVSLILKKEDWASVKCSSCGRSWPSPFDMKSGKWKPRSNQ